MENRRFKIHNLIAVICAVVISCVIVLGQLTVSMAYAAENAEVLTDLHRDSSFSESDYPYAPERTDLEVITIAEGVGEQLFIYVYNPSMNDKFNATYIGLSQTIGENYAPDDYGLGLVSYSGVFQKYYVKNLTLKQTVQRYYNITCIFRKFVEGIDTDCETETKNNVEQVSFPVSMCFTAETHSGNISYTCEGVEVVTITDKYVFNGKYPDGFNWYGFVLTEHKTVSHIVAFSTDLDIQKLFEVDIGFTTRAFTHTWQESSVNGYQPTNDNFVLSDEIFSDKVSVYGQDENGNDITVSNPGDTGWLFGHQYTWKRIQTANSFLQYLDNETIKGLSSYDRSQIANKQWVIAFKETEFTYREVEWPFLDSMVSNCTETGTAVENVTVMRLKFKCAKGVKNLGVVDNYQTGSINSTFEGKNDLEIFADKFNEFWELFIKVIGLIVLVVLLVLLLNFVTPIMSILKFIFKGIAFVITAPFKLLKRLFKRAVK